MALTLLTLPREVRDQIYKHIVHDLDYRHAIISKGHLCPKYGNIVRITVKDVPLVDLLLTHSRLYDEYKYATRSCTRSARIRLDTLSEFSALK